MEGPVTTADWYTVLKSEYPQWHDEPGLRLSRARADIQALLREILPRQAILPRQGDEPRHPSRGELTRTLQAPLHVTYQSDERARTADDAVLAALFRKAERVMLPDETPYNLEHELQVFTGWLDRQPHRRPRS
jgi:hypothetical protein